MNKETLNVEKEIPFQNGEKPTVEDFKEEKTLSGTDTKGNQVKYVLLSDKGIVTIREGKGSDVERATMEASGDQSKYLSSMMAACVKIDGKQMNMFDLAALKMKDYMNVQLAFSDLNF